MTHNPLHKYFRAVKLHTNLPSGSNYYDANDVEINDTGEVAVYAMTAGDEIALKNPDALLNGEAIWQLISSCIPAIKNPKVLLSNDVEVALIAIKHASNGGEITISTNCPKCSSDNEYTITPTQTLGTIESLDKEYTVEIENGIVFHLRPFLFTETLRALRMQFEQESFLKNVSSPDELTKAAAYSDALKKFVLLNAELLVNCILKITHVSDQDASTTDRDQIKEFLNNVESPVVESINRELQRINKIGSNRSFTATCSSCNHNWEAEINFNPTSFFTGS